MLLKLILAFSNSRQVSLGKVAHPLYPVYDCTENTRKTEKTDDLLSEMHCLHFIFFFCTTQYDVCSEEYTVWRLDPVQSVHQWIHEGRAREDLAVIFVMTADTNFDFFLILSSLLEWFHSTSTLSKGIKRLISLFFVLTKKTFKCSSF